MTSDLVLNYGRSASDPPSTTGIWRGEVTSISGDDYEFVIPRLTGVNASYKATTSVPVANDLAVGDNILLSFSEGRNDEIAVLGKINMELGSVEGYITGVTAGTNLNGGGTTGDVTLNLDADITLDSVTATDVYANLFGPTHIKVKNTSGGVLSKGAAVYATGSVGASGAVEVQASDADNASTMPALGLLDQQLADNGEGSATVLGIIRQVDTSAYSANDELYVSTTPGSLTNTRPSGATELVQKIGRVVRVDASTGEILVLGAGRTNDVPNGTLANDISGNAATATALETARTIGGVSFDGTANINLPGVNTTGNQDTSGNAATATLAADSSLLGGLGLSPGNSRPSTSVSQVVKTHTNGYTYLGWINTTSGSTTSTIDRIYASYDQFVRYVTPATFRSQVTDPHYLPLSGGTVTGALTAASFTTTGVATANEFRASDSGPDSDAAFTFVGDEDTGMYRIGGDRLGLSAGAVRMYVQNNSTGLTGASGRGVSIRTTGATEIYRQATGASDGILALYSNNGSTTDLQWLVYGDGDTASDTGSYGTISDNRLKTNIVAYKDPTDDLMAINVIKYDLSKTSTGIDDNGDPIIVDRDQATTMTGWDAQQVQGIKPGFVKLDAERGILSVKSSVFVPLLHRGFQVHEEKIAALEARIAALET